MAQVANTWPPVFVPQQCPNDSGVFHDRDKLADEAKINFTEVDGYREHFADNDDQATRVFDVAWDDRFNFVRHMRGYSTSAQSVDISHFPTVLLGPVKLQRTIPAQHPERPWLYCSRAELMSYSGTILNHPELFAQDDPDANPIPQFLDMVAVFDYSTGRNGLARYAVTYTSRNYTIRTDKDLTNNFQGNELARYVERQYIYSVNNLPYADGSLCFTDDPENPFKKQLVPVQGLFRIVGITGLQYTWYDVPDVPHSAIQNCSGKTNSLKFDGFDGYPSYDPGTVVCHTPKIKRRRNVNGRFVHDLEYYLTFRQIPWSHFAAKNGQFFAVVETNLGDAFPIPPRPFANPSDRPAIPQADLNTLFKPPSPVKYQ